MKCFHIQDTRNIANGLLDLLCIDSARDTFHQDRDGPLKDANSGEDNQDGKDKCADWVQVCHGGVKGDDK
jgi:hypothetical protein